MAVALTATEVDVYPPRVTLALTGLTVSDVITLTRVVDGAATAVRGADTVTVVDTSFLAFDAELPFGVPVTYYAFVNGSLVGSAGPTTYTLTGGKVALSDAISGQAAEVVITAWPDKTSDRESALLRVGGRLVAVLGDRGGYTSQITVVTETDSSRENLSALLDSATSGVLQIRQPGPYGGVDAYLAILSDTESRYSQDGTDTRRLWTLDVAEVDAWAPELATLAFTFADFGTAYTGLTFADFDTDFAGSTFLDFDLTDWST